MDTIVRILATFFGIGYIPGWAPTWASAVAAGLAWILPPTGTLAAFIVFTLLGFWACAPAIRVLNHKDPRPFVLDEVCGMLLTVLWVPRTALVYGAGFLLFRAFDAGKPWPISRVQQNPHPWCIVWDDLAAGLAANLVLQVAIRTILKPEGF